MKSAHGGSVQLFDAAVAGAISEADKTSPKMVLNKVPHTPDETCPEIAEFLKGKLFGWTIALAPTSMTFIPESNLRLFVFCERTKTSQIPDELWPFFTRTNATKPWINQDHMRYHYVLKTPTSWIVYGIKTLSTVFVLTDNDLWLSAFLHDNMSAQENGSTRPIVPPQLYTIAMRYVNDAFFTQLDGRIKANCRAEVNFKSLFVAREARAPWPNIATFTKKTVKYVEQQVNELDVWRSAVAVVLMAAIKEGILDEDLDFLDKTPPKIDRFTDVGWEKK